MTGKLLTFASLVLCYTLPASAQRQPQVTIQSPFQTNRDSFFENSNIGWSVRGPNFFANFGNPTAGRPPFGGFNPNAGITGGFAHRNGPWSSSLNFNFAQGSSRTSTSTTPVITLMNGQPGYFTNSVQRPFVTGLVPVVNQGGVFPLQTLPQMTPLQQSLARGELTRDSQGRLRVPGFQRRTRTNTTPGPRTTTRQEPAAIVDAVPPTRRERLALKQAEQNENLQKAQQLIHDAQVAEEKGRKSVARAFYKMALKRAEGTPLVEEIEERLKNVR